MVLLDMGGIRHPLWEARIRYDMHQVLESLSNNRDDRASVSQATKSYINFQYFHRNPTILEMRDPHHHPMFSDKPIGHGADS